MAININKRDLVKIKKDIEDNFLSRDDAATANGIPKDKFDKFIDRSMDSINKYLVDSIEQSEAIRNRKLTGMVMSGSSRSAAAKWVLSRLAPDNFGRPGVDERKGKEKGSKEIKRERKVPKPALSGESLGERMFNLIKGKDKGE